MKKYEIIRKRNVGNLRQIRAVRDFSNIKTGELGGWIELDENLSHSGNAWVSGHAQVYGHARVYGNAQVSGHAQVYGDAQVSGHAQVYGNAWVSGHAQVYGDAQVYGHARVYGNAWVSGNAQVSGDARVYGNAQVSGRAQVSGDAWVSGNARVSGNALVFGNAQVSGDAWNISPLFIQGTKHSLCLPKHGVLKIGCLKKPIDEWDISDGKEDNFSEKEIQEYRLYVNVAAEWWKIYGPGLQAFSNALDKPMTPGETTAKILRRSK